jgi:hypothetical protein
MPGVLAALTGCVAVLLVLVARSVSGSPDTGLMNLTPSSIAITAIALIVFSIMIPLLMNFYKASRWFLFRAVQAKRKALFIPDDRTWIVKIAPESARFELTSSGEGVGILETTSRTLQMELPAHQAVLKPEDVDIQIQEKARLPSLILTARFEEITWRVRLLPLWNSLFRGVRGQWTRTLYHQLDEALFGRDGDS